MFSSKMILASFPVLLTSVLTGCNNNPGQEEVPPNVVIILTDDMGYGDISCYDDRAINTPNIDNLADKGVRCTDFYVPTPYCAPSRATLLTGRFPLRHGMVINPAPDAGIDDVGIGAEELLLGEVFKGAGYRTSLIGKWHLGHKEEYFPVKHGFDEYYGILYSNDMRPVQIIENLDTVLNPVDQAILTKAYTEKAIQFIRKNKESPFFLHLCHAMPHKPLAASREFYTPETPDDLYHDVISELDWSVGAVIKELEEQKLLDKTIIIFMSDNGGSFGANNLPLKGKKANNWEGGVRVPFIISYPEILPSGLTVETPCWSPDLFPTLLQMTGIEMPSDLIVDGEDIVEIFKGKQISHRDIYTMSGNEIKTIRRGEWKLFVKRPKFYHPVDLENWAD
ncbi:MAG: sulfatase-like hydrolase/transferase, partial [Bacteroidales bacterium]